MRGAEDVSEPHCCKFASRRQNLSFHVPVAWAAEGVCLTGPDPLPAR
jgi:hypothetical protein